MITKEQYTTELRNAVKWALIFLVSDDNKEAAIATLQAIYSATGDPNEDCGCGPK